MVERRTAWWRAHFCVPRRVCLYSTFLRHATAGLAVPWPPLLQEPVLSDDILRSLTDFR